jgi:serine/threonine protein kinase
VKGSALGALSGNMGVGMSDAEQQGPLRVGQRFLKFTLRGQIGRGGHAWVYHGHDPFLDHDVAIKILHRHGGVTADMLRRGQAEAKLLFRLRHPNIVEVLDAGISDEGLLYIVMELLHGKSLREVLRDRGSLPPREALELFLDIVKGVEAAHSFGAIHRDLKPENVFILADGSCKILDFGIAKVVDAAGMTTERDVLHGTILYISPEQLEGFRATPQSDLYSLGLVLFETLYGRHPLLLKETNPTFRDLSLMQIGFQPPRLDELDSHIPRHVARIVERLMMKSPLQRVQSTHELRAALTESLRRLADEEAGVPVEITPSDSAELRIDPDTERIPLGELPDRATLRSLEAHTRTERYLSQARMHEGAHGALPKGPLHLPDLAPANIARDSIPVPQSSQRVTAPPLTTPVVHSDLTLSRLNERESSRQRAARALAAGALVGVAAGLVYLLLHFQTATRPVAADVPTKSANAAGREPPLLAPSAALVPAPPVAAEVASPAHSVNPATTVNPATSANPTSTASPVTTAKHSRSRRPAAGSHKDAAARPAADGAGKAWLE